MFSLNLFKRAKTVPMSSNQDEAKSENPSKINFVKRTGTYTRAEHVATYATGPSFPDRLPWVEFLDEEKALLLEDGHSVGAIYEVIPLGTEGRSTDYLRNLRNVAKDALQDSFDELDVSPWVVQFYCQDDPMAKTYSDVLRRYVHPRAKGSQFTENWLELMDTHLQNVSKPGGLFVDEMVTNTPWKGQQRRVRMVVYRYLHEKSKEDIEPLESLNITCEKLTNALEGAGLQCYRQNGHEVHDWLLRWFNPAPTMLETAEKFYTACAYPEKYGETEDDLILWQDFAETLLVTPPKIENGYWHFDGKPHDVIIVDHLRKAPPTGLLTGELPRGDNKMNALFDLLPENTTMVITVVATPQDLLENHLLYIAKKAIGDNNESKNTRIDCVQVQEYLAKKQKMYHSSLAFYVQGDNVRDLERKSRRLRSTLTISGLVPVAEGTEIAHLNSYLRWLPMNFNPQDDARQHLYTKFNFVQHITNLLPIFGRKIGTRHPGLTYFNRGGAPLDFDPFSKKDRTKNGHGLILGPTGAGKSATLNGNIAQIMALYKPRLFIVEAGNSFGLLADYAERYGLTINKVSLKPGSGISLPLFSDAQRLIDEKNISQRLTEEAVAEEEEVEDIPDTDEGDDQRDILGELEITARLMITGGEVKEDEKLTRQDKATIREAILLAAKTTYAEGRQTLTQDVRDAFYTLSGDESLPKKKRERAYELGDALGLFCIQGSFEDELFNREGTPWPEADITLVDLATLAKEGYEAQLSIAYISLINHINALGEKHQHSGRPIINITDEAHIITVNPMLAAFLTKGSKMWRKLGIWLWLATQNMKDFPKDAAKLLGMLEWWILLTGVDENEMTNIEKFKKLNDDQKRLIRSAKKEDRKYTEGVVLSDRLEALFRVVPPSLYLALAMTEPEEKAERMMLMREKGISELDAAILVAQRIDEARGIVA
ncbi:TPA: conjugative transfer ATPase [Pasteurella multocida]|uniref:conjugative transfer ATPase n=1 Tax=Pasteurella multocida TaxID=747 RepID=UPI00202266AF|nr:conjugative transfer ATPase [Pasteurella multocida]MCL7827368.1 conjugative transfer ATPase [Pasteurella multocida]HDR1435570.1 conjugative transfer ATPase [Pasteurella multocida]HDR1793428.1 conjugative transfer ATPase [Pasteurella multocida]HDR1868183.1 conjugative transfer ATPase [Pasteurella multocida]HED4416810.1 conjugative transfer ATPase [Pasteurella multocida]